MMNMMMQMMALMAGEAVSPIYNALKLTLIIIASILAVILVIVILLQSGNENGLGEIAGGSSDSYLGKNRSKTVEGKLKKWTIIVASVFVVCILALTIIINLTF